MHEEKGLEGQQEKTEADLQLEKYANSVATNIGAMSMIFVKIVQETLIFLFRR